MFTGNTYNLYKYDGFNSTTSTINDGWELNDAYVWVYDNIFSADTNYSAYTEVNDIVELEYHGLGMLDDYQERRSAVKAFHYRKGWTGCTNDEKDIIIDWYAHPNIGTGSTQDTEKVIHLMTTKGMSQAVAGGYLLDMWHDNWVLFRENCPSRWEMAVKIVGRYLNLDDASDLSDTVESLKGQYLTDGRLGIGFGDSQNGLMNYIMSDNMYDDDGLEDNLYILRQGTWEDFKGELTDWLVCKYFWNEINANKPTE